MAFLHPSPQPVLKGLLALLASGSSVLIGLGSTPWPVGAQSQLLESVKQNPARAQALCTQLRSLNAQGLSATSPQAVAQIARQDNLSPMDAEVLTTYVIGLHCPDVR
jgi:hypothetical protein